MTDAPTGGFVKMVRSQATDRVLRDPNAFALLALIASRARYSDPKSLDGLSFGQALIGDHDECGLSRKEYRGALGRLRRWGLVSTNGTPAGTIATLLDSRVFSLRDERYPLKKGQPEGHQFPEVKPTNWANDRANEGPSKGHLGATNQKDRRAEFNKRRAGFAA